MRKIIFISFNILLLSLTVFSQDNNYWKLQYGSKASLLGGAVIGGVRDNSAVFYNPGALGFLDSTTVSVTSDGYEYSMFKIKNGGGNGINLTSNGFQIIPLLSLTGIIKLNKNSNSTFGYALIQKNQIDVNSSFRTDNILPNVIDDPDYLQLYGNTQEYIGQYDLNTSLNEIWVGGSWSYQISKHISLGVSPFVAYRSQSLSKSFLSRAYPDSSSNYYNNGWGTVVESWDDVSNITLDNIRSIVKIGASFNFNKFKIGLTVTSPSINIYGSGMVSRDINYSGVTDTSSNISSSTTSGLVPWDYNFDDRQDNLKSIFKSPLCIGFGLEYTFGKNTTIDFSGEYFSPIVAYNLISPASNNLRRPIWFDNICANEQGDSSINSKQYLRVREASKSVINFALGIEQVITHSLSFLASFRTDFTSYKQASTDLEQYWGAAYGNNPPVPYGQQLSISNVDLYHITLGSIIKRKKSDFYIGLLYSFGSNSSYPQLLNLSSPSDVNNNLGGIPDVTKYSTYSYKALSIIMAYTYHLKD